MNNNPIEDIVIEKHTTTKKKGGKVILRIIFILLIILILLYGAYWYLKTNSQGTNKQIFFNAISNANIQYFTQNEVYQEMLNKLITTNSETETSISASTTMELPEAFSEIDISKFQLNFSTINKPSTKTSYYEIGMSYSDNALLDMKMVNSENTVGVFVEDVVNRYVGYNKDSEAYQENKDSYSISSVDEIISTLKNDNTDLTDELKSSKIESYIESLSEILLDEKFVAQDNYVLNKDNGDSVNVTAYSIELSQDETEKAVDILFTKLENDDELLQAIITGESSETETTTDDSEENTSFELNSANTVNSSILDPVGEVETEDVELEIGEEPDLTEVGEEELEVYNETNVNLNEVGEDENTTSIYSYNYSEEGDGVSVESNTNVSASSDVNTLKIIYAIIFNQKVDLTLTEIKNTISEYKNNLNIESGIKITVYVSETDTEKITIEFSETESLDFEFKNTSSTERNVIITYLAEEDTIDFGDDDAVIFSANDNTVSEEIPNSVTETEINGFKIDITKVQNDASTNIKTVYSNIKNQEVISKLSMDLNTTGTVSSMTYDNELIIKYTSEDGEVSLNLNNSMKFNSSKDVEDLTEENCLFLDTLSDEEYNATIQAISEKFNEIMEERKASLDFIDTNNQTSLILQENNSNTTETETLSRDAARDLLVETISNLMTQALNNGEEFTLNNLEGLQIENYNVEITIENDVANITVDGVAFTLDSNFNLSDA